MRAPKAAYVFSTLLSRRSEIIADCRVVYSALGPFGGYCPVDVVDMRNFSLPQRRRFEFEW